MEDLWQLSFYSINPLLLFCFAHLSWFNDESIRAASEQRARAGRLDLRELYWIAKK